MRRALTRRAIELALTATACGFLLGPWANRARAGDDAAAEALRNLMNTAISAARAGNEANLEEIARNLRIPNYGTWFKTAFGEEQGTKLATAYAAHVDQDEKALSKMFQGMAKPEGELLVEDAGEPNVLGGNYCGQSLLKLVKNGATFFRASKQGPGPSGQRWLLSAGYYTLVEGAYRRLDCQSLGLVAAPIPPHPINGPLRVGGNVQASRIINRVQPVYPPEARDAGITGTVRLHVILAKDGTVKELELVSGHPALAKAAMDAVRQWTYRQTLLNGEPVEIDTIIDVVFSM